MYVCFFFSTTRTMKNISKVFYTTSHKKGSNNENIHITIHDQSINQIILSLDTH